MRIAALFATSLLCVLGGCWSSAKPTTESPYEAPNALMGEEIGQRISQIPYQHREELLQNLLWLAQTGEQSIPALTQNLNHENPKVRSSCAWVLGRIHDRRCIPELQKHLQDESETVRLEVARQLIALGDLNPSPSLIEGLDSDKKEVRFLCHEALKTATGRDFGYDHLSEDQTQRRTAVLGWRQWWSEYTGDPFFAQNYAQKYNLQAHPGQTGQPAQPSGETKPQDKPMPETGTNPNGTANPNGNSNPPAGTTGTPGNGNGTTKPSGGN